MKTHGELRWEDGSWHLKAAPYMMIRAKRLFPRANQYRTGFLVMSDTPEVSRDLEWLTGRYPVVVDDAAAARLRGRADEHRATENVVLQILNGDLPDVGDFEPARPARGYQEVAAALAIATGRLLLIDDVGLGKSMSSLLALRKPGALPALVVCLTHLPRQWEGEIEKTFPWMKTHIVTSLQPYDPSKKRGANGRPDVLIMPYSKIRGWGDYLAGQVSTVIFDEVQELRVPGSQKYVASARVADEASQRIGLSATPVYNYGDEIHAITNVVAPDVLGSREEFMREWCGGDYRKARVNDPAALGLYLRDQGVMLRRTRRDVGRELPPLIPVPHVVESDTETLDALAGDAVGLADIILSRSSDRTERFRASGELDWRLRRATGVAKAPYVAEFVRLLLESEERVVLYGWHRDVYAEWSRRLADLNPAFYTGTESPKRKHEAVGRFLSNESRVLIVSLRAGAGLDGLQGGCHVCVFGELDWSPGIHIQCMGRLHRDGQDESVIAYFLVSDEGSDPEILDVLNVKRMQSSPIVDPEMEPLQRVEGIENRVRALAEAVRSRAAR